MCLLGVSKACRGCCFPPLLPCKCHAMQGTDLNSCRHPTLLEVAQLLAQALMHRVLRWLLRVREKCWNRQACQQCNFMGSIAPCWHIVLLSLSDLLTDAADAGFSSNSGSCWKVAIMLL